MTYRTSLARAACRCARSTRRRCTRRTRASRAPLRTGSAGSRTGRWGAVGAATQNRRRRLVHTSFGHRYNERIDERLILLQIDLQLTLLNQILGERGEELKLVLLPVRMRSRDDFLLYKRAHIGQ